ncbi:MAG: DUF4149 domain-containing protein [Sulfuricurvum sp.]|nr:DUF4149 domain-containing protein [Sulfuricurvum sp.]
MNRKALVDIFYLLTIAMTAGAVLILGAFVAAVVFHSELYLSIPLLSRYEEGKIMGEIFRRFTYWSYIMAIIIVGYEIARFKAMQIDTVSIMASFGSVGTLLLFSGVYSPKMLEFQQLGEAAMMNNSFESLHKASEIDFKIMLVMLLVLFSRRAYLLVVKR